jgi:hypothetical protein
MKRKDPYQGRHAKPQRALREPTKQPGGKLPKSATGGTGDTRDLYLAGKQVNPFSLAHDEIKKRR